VSLVFACPGVVAVRLWMFCWVALYSSVFGLIDFIGEGTMSYKENFSMFHQMNIEQDQ
jgi:hypothetical protein